MRQTNIQETKEYLQPKPLPEGYKEMVETEVLVNEEIKTLITFEEEKTISPHLKASEQSLRNLKLGGEDLTQRKEMPHFYRANIMSDSVKEQLEKTRDYLDYIQAQAEAEAKAEEIKSKTPYENLKGE